MKSPTLSALFLDFVGFGIFISLLPFLFGENPYCICPDLIPSKRYFLLGLFLGTFSLTQAIANFLFSPKLNDPTKVHKLVMLAYLANCIGYLVAGLAISHKNIFLLFLSNIFSGFFSTNIAGTQIILSRGTTEEKVLPSYSMIPLVTNLGLLMCSFLFPPLVDQKFSIALFLPCIFSFLGFLLVFFQNTEIHEISVSEKKPHHFNLFFFLSTAFFASGWALFIKFFQVHALENLNLSAEFVAKFLRYMSLGALLNFVFVSKIKVAPPKYFSLLILSLILLIPISIYQKTDRFLPLLLTLGSFCYHGCHVLFPFIVRKFFANGKDWIPLYHSSMGIGKLAAPFLGGFYALYTQKLPFPIAIGLLLSSGMLLIFLVRSRRENQRVSP